MTDLPTGTVTFLFTDLQGSTALWEDEPEAAHAALVRHDEIVATVVDRYGGILVRPRGEGDSRFAVFTRATDGVAAAAALQQAFHVEPWATRSPIKVRIALHTGEADLRAGDYYGASVNRCARLRAVAHGGQTLISHATFDLVRDAVAQDLVPGVSLRDLGEQRLKDLIRPEHIHQVVVAGLPDSFPPLLALDRHRHNLPVQRSPLLGREQAVAEVTTLLLRPDVGLVTLTGPGGTGKTRLGLQVAAEVVGSFVDGVYFVDLAPISDPDLVVATIAQILKVTESSSRPLLDSLRAYLRDTSLLLVLDNFEQVIPAAPIVVQLLQAAPQLKVLVTSREILHVRDEQEYGVRPLEVPDLGHFPPLERLGQYGAVQLFIQRAQSIKADFQVTHANAPAIAEICARLDGLPLAIELAATRVKVLSPEMLLQRLGSRLKLLTGGQRDLATRQQTLKNTIDWSYDLLTTEEQVLFRRLAVFAGGRSVEAIEAVCNGDGIVTIDLLDGLQSLIDKSLVVRRTRESEEARFVLLETIHEYARERLVASGERDAIAQAHAAFFAAFAGEAARGIQGTQQLQWLDRLEQELPNLREAMAWLLDHAPDMAAGIAGNLEDFWTYRSHYSEGLLWADRALRARPGKAPAARVVRTIGTLAWAQGDYAKAAVFHQQALEMYTSLGDQHGIAVSLANLAAQRANQDDIPGAVDLYRQALERFRELGDQCYVGSMLNNLAVAAEQQGELEQATAGYQEAYRLAVELGNPVMIATTLNGLGTTAKARGQYDAALDFLIRGLDISRQIGDKRMIATFLDDIAVVLARYPVTANAGWKATWLFGVVQGLRESMTGVTNPFGHPNYQQDVDQIRTKLVDDAFARGLAEGQSLSWDEAIGRALQLLSTDGLSV